jgi:hypothetical protein
MKIDREKLHELYMLEINRIADACEWKSNFGPEEIIDIISNIIEKNPILINED